MKKNNKFLIAIICVFVFVLSITTYISFSSNTDTQEVIVKSITPVYDSNSTIEVENNNVVFNDKNQVVEYKVVIENTQDYDVKITDIVLSTPTEEFLQYAVEDLQKDDVLEANETKKFIIHLETMGIEGWGRNFQDELTANISFEMVPKNEESTSSPEVNDKEYDSTEDEPNTDNNEDTTEDNSSEKEDLNDENEVTKPNTDNNTQNDSKDDNVAENPYTNTGELILYIAVTGISVVVIFVLKNKKVNKYLILAFILSSALSFVKAENQIELSISFDVSFKSQNVMKPSGFEWDSSNYELLSDNYGADYWAYAMQIKNFYIQNEILEIDEYAYEFDVTEANNGRVMAYLVERDNDSFCYNFDWEEDVCYDLYLQADGIIYPNENASYYFAAMEVLGEISNLSGIDTSEVTDMRGMFSGTGSSVEFTLDVSNFDTSNVTDMSYMFENVGAISENLTLDLSNFNTSNVTNMSSMFTGTGTNSENLTLDVSNFDTSRVIDMSSMFNSAGYSSIEFTLDVSNFDTSKVTDMSGMFYLTGGMSEIFTLDVSGFDTSNVTNMSRMFELTGGISEIFTLDVSNFDTSNVTDMSSMFSGAGYNSENFTLDLSNFDTSNVTDMSAMFAGTDSNSGNFILDLSNFDTSKVTNMSYMFYNTGSKSTNFTLDLGDQFDTSNVTDMSSMFENVGAISENLTLDLSNFNTSNVTNMSSMFTGTGRSSTEFTLDLGDKFDTSNVTDMSAMFLQAGYNSTKLNTSITISNPNINLYSSMFNNVATKEGSQITVNYTEETDVLVSKMIDTKTEGANVVKGYCINCSSGYVPMGTEIDINGEKFNVISQTEDTITMLAQYNLGTDYKQSTTANSVNFSDGDGWEYTPGPKEIDIQTWSTNPKTYVNAYVVYLKEKIGDNTVTGNLITLTELSNLGCIVPSDYAKVSSSSLRTCANSPYKSWLLNGQWWWTRSASSSICNNVWSVSYGSGLSSDYYEYYGGVRPVITISKEALKNLN